MVSVQILTVILGVIVTDKAAVSFCVIPFQRCSECYLAFCTLGHLVSGFFESSHRVGVCRFRSKAFERADGLCYSSYLCVFVSLAVELIQIIPVRAAYCVPFQRYPVVIHKLIPDLRRRGSESLTVLRRNGSCAEHSGCNHRK